MKKPLQILELLIEYSKLEFIKQYQRMFYLLKAGGIKNTKGKEIKMLEHSPREVKS